MKCSAVHPSGVACAHEAGHRGNHRPRTRHTCHWPGCVKEVPPAMWGCRAHWFRLPKGLRDRIWGTYVRGQEITKTPSAEYVEAAEDVQRWIKEQTR